jgi:hypothetical protein
MALLDELERIGLESILARLEALFSIWLRDWGKS